MAAQIPLHIGATLTIVWGIAHLFPTKSVLRGFGSAFCRLDYARLFLQPLHC